MEKKRYGNRSAYSLLPFKIRYFMVCMLHDGATAKAVLEHPTVREALKETGTDLTTAAVARIRNTAEYAEIVEQRKKARETYSGLQLNAALLQDCEAAATIAEQLKINLLELVRQCTAAKPDKPQELERLVRAAVHLSNSTKDFRINSLKAKLSALSDENLKLKRELVRSRKESQEKKCPDDPEAIADRLSEILGVKCEEQPNQENTK